MKELQQKNMEIDLRDLLYRLWNKRFFIAKIAVVCLFVGFVVAYSIPKTYKVEVTLSPESGQTGSNNFSGMASMLGMGNIGGVTQDALNSTMFPDLIKSTPYILEMYHLKVTTCDGREMLLPDYIKTQKKPWWGHIIGLPGMAIRNVVALFAPDDEKPVEAVDINPFRLTHEQKVNIEAIKNALSVSVDGKSNMTVVSTTFQDPVVAAVVADSAVMKLQEYIIAYRIRKAQADCEYLEKLCKERKDEYIKTQRAYADFMDKNRNVVLQRAQAEGTSLQNDMSMAFQVYNQVETQLQVARAKVQEAKPVFAIVEPATVPLYPVGPNKLLIVVGFIFLGVLFSSIWVLFGKDMWSSFRQGRIVQKEEME